MDLKFEISTTCSLAAARRISALLRKVLLPLVAKPSVYALELALAKILVVLTRQRRQNGPETPLDVILELDCAKARLTVVDRGPPLESDVFRRAVINNHDSYTLPVNGRELPLVYETLNAIKCRREKDANVIGLAKSIARIDLDDEGAPDRDASTQVQSDSRGGEITSSRPTDNRDDEGGNTPW